VTGERAYIGVGSNLGDRIGHCRRAMEEIVRVAGIRPATVSSFYESAPVPPASGRWFVNAVIAVDTTLAPDALLRELQRIEQSMGRAPVRLPGDDRVIDLDLLLVGAQRVDRPPDLVLPHPRLHQRRFVLVPLCELAPDCRHPVLGRTMRELLERLDDPSPVRPVAPAQRLAPTG
jgi:2-amino-4-hydroxy-6-hydroxymethyldihydropteridine diphosphokinase